jgi:hypothetical protein
VIIQDDHSYTKIRKEFIESMFMKKISANVEENALLELTDEQLTQVTGGISVDGSVTGSASVTGGASATSTNSTSGSSSTQASGNLQASANLTTSLTIGL